MAARARKSPGAIPTILISLLILFGWLAGCTPAPAAPPPANTPSAAPTATPIPTETATPTMAVTPKLWTPGPTPTAMQVSVPPGECVVSPPLRGNVMDVQRVGETLCFVWADEFENESGFRLMLQFGYNGKVFLYDLPASTTGMPFPPILLEPLGQSFEYCMEHKDYDITLYALLPGQEPQPFTGFGAGGECSLLDMPTATPGK